MFTFITTTILAVLLGGAAYEAHSTESLIRYNIVQIVGAFWFWAIRYQATH